MKFVLYYILIINKQSIAQKVCINSMQIQLFIWKKIAYIKSKNKKVAQISTTSTYAFLISASVALRETQSIL